METAKDVYELLGGFLVSKDPIVSDFIETLIDKGIVWEYLSNLLEKEVIGGGTPLISNVITPSQKEIEDKLDALTKQVSQIADLMSKGDTRKETISNLVQTTNDIVDCVPKLVQKKKPPKKGLGGKFGAAAAKMGAASRR